MRENKVYFKQNANLFLHTYTEQKHGLRVFSTG